MGGERLGRNHIGKEGQRDSETEKQREGDEEVSGTEVEREWKGEERQTSDKRGDRIGKMMG